MKNLIINLTVVMIRSICILCICVNILLAEDLRSQNLNKINITLDLNNVTLKEALNEIEHKTDFRFSYFSKSLTFAKNHYLTLNAENISVGKVLKSISEKTGVSFQQKGKSIAVNAPKMPPPSIPKKKLLPEKIIRGKITDENGEPLPGANILVKGTTIGVVSDGDGNYALNVDGNVTTLVASFIGYVTQEINISGRSVIDIVMIADVTSLEGVIVSTGYWQVEQELNTGSIAQVKAEEIARQPISNPLQALQGTMAGVNVQQSTGLPGGGFEISIRGRNSLREDGNEPLYLVNGVPFPSNPLTNQQLSGVKLGANPLASINPNDIETIEILKDADATAIYGSRGANGVVLITTKKGSGDKKAKLNFGMSQGVGRVTDRMDLLNSEQYVALRREGIINAGFGGLPTSTLGRFLPDAYIWDSTRFTDWQEELIGGTAKQTNANMSLSGGNAYTNFTLGGGYFRETTVFPGDNNFRRLSGNFSLNHTSSDEKLKVSVFANYTSSTSNLPFSDLTTAALTLPPNAPALYDEAGNLNWEDGTWENPLADLERKYEDQTDNLVVNANLSYQVMPGLRFKANLGYTSMIFNSYRLEPISAINPVEIDPTTTASTSFNDGTSNTWIVEPQMEYTRSISKGQLTVLVGGTFQNTESENESSRASGFTSDAFLLNKEAASEITIFSTNFIQYRYGALFARINYNWNGKYILNLTGRRDGSSRFGPNKQFGNFGAIGVAWIFSEEDFMQFDFLSFGKLRASYGVTGSDQIPNYEFLDTYTFTEPYNDVTGLEVTRLANPEFSWESTNKLEIGLELGLLQDRISTTVNWYRNRTQDQLLNRPLSLVTGDNSLRFNLPAIVENSGWELTLNTINVSTNAFKWSTSFNLTIPENKLLEFNDINRFPQFDGKWEVGRSIIGGSQKLYQFNGINPESGLYEFEDFNGDGQISIIEDGRKFVELGQEYFGGIGNNLSYKSFQLSFHFQFVKQSSIGQYRFLNPPGFSAQNQPIEVLNRWQRPGDISDFQQVMFSGPAITSFFQYVNSDQMKTNTSFVRLRNVSLSYTLPSDVISRLKVANLRVFMEAQNVWTISDFKGLNPENSTGNRLPPLEIYTAGFQVTL